MKTFLLYLLASVIGFICYALYNNIASSQKTMSVVSKASLTPTSMPFSVSPAPANAITGTISALSGDVLWQSRVSSDESKLEKSQNILQGEVVKTEEGSVTLLFPNACNISLEADTTTSFLQTIPNNIVISQNSGTATYTRLSSIPVTIRVGRLLVDLQKDAEVTIAVDDTEVTITTENKQVELGYNDLELVSQRVMIDEGKEISFDIETRTLN